MVEKKDKFKLGYFFFFFASESLYVNSIQVTSLIFGINLSVIATVNAKNHNLLVSEDSLQHVLL